MMSLLHYKPDDRGVDFRWGHGFFIDLISPLRCGIHSTSSTGLFLWSQRRLARDVNIAGRGGEKYNCYSTRGRGLNLHLTKLDGMERPPISFSVFLVLFVQLLYPKLTIGSPTYHLAKHLTNMLQPLIGTCEHHVKNSTEFVRILENITVVPSDLLVSFDVISLFTKVPIKEALELVAEQFPDNILQLFRLALTTTYFTYNNSATHKPSHFFRYVDDTFVVWPHGQDKLQEFLQHLNSIHANIQFTMEVESEGSLPFLDIHIHRKADGTLGHGVYRKPTHTDLYLNALSLHHPSQKKSVLTSLLHRAIVISDINNLPAEMDHLRRTLQQNNYSRRDISKALKQVTTRCNTIDLDSKQEPTKKAFIPFCGSVSHKISRILQKVNIKTIHKPQSKIRSHLRQVKDSQGLRTPGIYKIPCECGEVYIGQTGRTIEDRIKEHKRSLRLYYPEKSAVAQHSIEKEHKILFDHTKVINKSSHYWDRTIKEAIEIKLEKNNFNRDSGLQLSQAWTPALDQLRPSYNQGHEDHGPRTATDSNRRNRARRPPNFTQ
ncbi:hypothetical protein ANN_23392 [Periplaneta americana]|uniref:GIY-YIG domain-containing protein n=1 Tax=Periplaneta americana TaxID=6978 RepID=A0ABQ8SM07_PERAM|nr:hypothetical protein ANN_23392 [Periplaneta americana]